MIQNVKEYIEPYVALDEPVEYKGLKIYPILVRDSNIFEKCYDILTIDKNKSSIEEIIKMSTLEFIFTILFNDDTVVGTENRQAKEIWIEKFGKILELCLKINLDNVNVLVENNRFYLMINDIKLRSKDFDELRKIILFQNLYNYDDRYVDSDVQKILNQKSKMQNKDIEQPTLEKKMMFVVNHSNLSVRDIVTMTYRHFNMIFDMNIDEMEYKINKLAYMTGHIDSKEKMVNYMFEKEKDVFESLFKSADTFKESIGL